MSLFLGIRLASEARSRSQTCLTVDISLYQADTCSAAGVDGAIDSENKKEARQSILFIRKLAPGELESVRI